MKLIEYKSGLQNGNVRYLDLERALTGEYSIKFPDPLRQLIDQLVPTTVILYKYMYAWVALACGRGGRKVWDDSEKLSLWKAAPRARLGPDRGGLDHFRFQVPG